MVTEQKKKYTLKFDVDTTIEAWNKKDAIHEARSKIKHAVHLIDYATIVREIKSKKVK
jgi:hypothetical protein